MVVSSVSSSISYNGIDAGSVIHHCESVVSLSCLFFLFSLTVFAKGFFMYISFVKGQLTLAPVDSVSVVSVAVPVAVVGAAAASHSVWSSCMARFHPIARSRDLLFPLRQLSSVDHGSISLGQATTCYSDLGPPWAARVTAHL